jgi:hypothetical protein
MKPDPASYLVECRRTIFGFEFTICYGAETRYGDVMDDVFVCQCSAFVGTTATPVDDRSKPTLEGASRTRPRWMGLLLGLKSPID